MKKTLLIILGLFIIFTALLLIAQEKGNANEGKLISIKNPAQDTLWTWMIGEWEGWSESQMGKTKDWMMVEWGLNKQFVITHLKSRITDVNEKTMKSMSEQLNLSEKDVAQMVSTPYSGYGFATIDPESCEIHNYWFDSYRRFYKGTETRNGKQFTMHMTGPVQITRNVEIVDDNKMIGTFKNVEKDGTASEGTFEMTRLN